MTKEKTVLIYVQDYLRDADSSIQFQEELNMPLGILYLGSYLNSHGYNTRLMDTRLHRKEDFFKILQRELDDSISVGFSVMTPCVGNALEMTKFVKETNPIVKTVWGGIHPTLFPESTILNEYIDFAIVKEGEKGLLGLVEYLSGKETKIFDIPNFVFKENNRVVKNRIEIESNLESLGVPNYNLLEMDRYIERLIRPGYRRRQAEIISARGCPYRCTFCVNTIVYESKWRGEPLTQTVKNLDYLIEAYNVEHIFFMDEDFFCNRKKTKDLVNEIAKRNITWEANCRADYISSDYINDGFLTLLKESGCIKLRFGLESGSQRILDLLKKDITTEQSVNAIQKLTEYGILPFSAFMMGLPEETEDDIIKTMNLILKLFTLNPAMSISGPLIFRPYPGSELFRKCQEKGLIVPNNLDEWSDFYIHNNLSQYRKGLPWFPRVYIFKRVGLCMAYIRFCQKGILPIFLTRYIVKFHIMVKLKFIEVDYSIYRFLKRFIRILR